MKYLGTLALIACLAGALSAATIWQDRNLYSSDTNLAPGNVIVVAVNDISDLRFTLSFSNQISSAVNANPDATITGFLPKISATKKTTADDRTQMQGKGSLKLTVATRILNRAANGMYAIAGSKTYTFNGASTVITVTGLVDPGLLRGRTIDARHVADFGLEIRGLKEGMALQRAALKQDETAKSDLTEDEKQKIIVDYLQKMLREIMR